MIKYKEHLKGKTIYCNCDDPAWSSFVRYFIMQFNYFGLKRLIATGYTVGSGALTNQIDLVDLMLMQSEEQLKEYENNVNKSYYIDINSVSQKLSDYFTDNAEKNLSNYDLLKNLKEEGFIKELDGNGDFRSKECIDLLQQSDIVITNPPFSLFREYIEQLFKYKKKFLIIGNKNAITYKEVFKHIKENELWIGYSNVKMFINNKFEEQHFGNVGWFTNLEISKRNEPLILYKKYYGEGEEAEKNKANPNYTNPDYPKYDNYDAIEVSKVVDIPCDYYGVMGVPITFLDKYSPKQFEVVKFRKGDDEKDLTYTQNCEQSPNRQTDRQQQYNHTSEYSFVIVGIDTYAEGNTMPGKRMYINGKKQYVRILIKRV